MIGMRLRVRALLDGRRSDRSRSCRAASGPAPRSRTARCPACSRASSALATAVVMTSPLPISSTMALRWTSSSSTTSSRFTLRSRKRLQAADGRAQRLQVGGLLQEGDGPLLQAAALVVQGRDHVHRDVAGARVVLQLIQHHPAVHVRQAQVQGDRRRGSGCGPAPGPERRWWPPPRGSRGPGPAPAGCGRRSRRPPPPAAPDRRRSAGGDRRRRWRRRPRARPPGRRPGAVRRRLQRAAVPPAPADGRGMLVSAGRLALPAAIGRQPAAGSAGGWRTRSAGTG